MKIGIPLFGKRVSPHYSTAPELFVILTHGNTIYSTTILNLSQLSLTEKRRKLVALGIETVICGGIDEETSEWLRKKNIRVIENMMGKAMDVLSGFLLDEARSGNKPSRERMESNEKKGAEQRRAALEENKDHIF